MRANIFSSIIFKWIDGKDVVSNIAMSKISSKAALNEKFEALERAEEAYYRNKRLNKKVQHKFFGFFIL